MVNVDTPPESLDMFSILVSKQFSQKKFVKKIFAGNCPTSVYLIWFSWVIKRHRRLWFWRTIGWFSHFVYQHSTGALTFAIEKDAFFSVKAITPPVGITCCRSLEISANEQNGRVVSGIGVGKNKRTDLKANGNGSGENRPKVGSEERSSFSNAFRFSISFWVNFSLSPALSKHWQPF